MNQEDKIFLLQSELQQAISTVEFLHSCLTDPIYRYDYPEQTLKHLELWRKLVPKRNYCFHSKHHYDCPSCQNHIAWYHRYQSLMKELNENS